MLIIKKKYRKEESRPEKESTQMGTKYSALTQDSVLSTLHTWPTGFIVLTSQFYTAGLGVKSGFYGLCQEVNEHEHV